MSLDSGIINSNPEVNAMPTSRQFRTANRFLRLYWRVMYRIPAFYR
jgi:hypothetical protein